jgi:hypothetical protein
MPWIYHQASGKIYHDGELVSALGYAGQGMWKNNPGGEMLKNKGPLPRGTYTIASHFIHHPTAGKHVLRLTPASGNQMFGRSGFLIHGDRISAPGTASDGCIVLPFAVRQKILSSGDRTLEVRK